MPTNFPGSLDTFTTLDHNLAEAVIALETQARQDNKNILYHSLSHDIWQEGATFNDAADDTYVADLWNVLWNTNAPDWSGQAGGASDPFSRYLRCTHDANSQAGIVQFIETKDTVPLRGKTLSLSADLWGTGVTTLRMAVIEWTSTADTVTSDVVGTWGTGNPTLAANWAYIGTPAAITITTTRTRYAVNNLTVGASTNNIAVFIWTDAVEVNTDLWNVARVKLEVGTAATDFVAIKFIEELGMCQRFVYNRTDGGGHPHGVGQAASTSVLRGFMPTPVTMFRNPTLTLGTITMRGNGASRTVTSSDTPLFVPNGIIVNLNDSGAGLTANHSYMFYGSILVDARL